MIFFIISVCVLLLLCVYVFTHITAKQTLTVVTNQEQEKLYSLIERAGHFHPYDKNYLK